MGNYYFSYSYESVTKEDLKNAIPGKYDKKHENTYILKDDTILRCMGDGRFYDKKANLYEEIYEEKDYGEFESIGFVKR